MSFFKKQTTELAPAEQHAHVEHKSRTQRNFQIKTFVFAIAKASEADSAVNAFCAAHNVLSIVFDRNGANLLYRILYTL